MNAEKMNIYNCKINKASPSEYKYVQQFHSNSISCPAAINSALNNLLLIYITLNYGYVSMSMIRNWLN